jgi:hypothetical protein
VPGAPAALVAATPPAALSTRLPSPPLLHAPAAPRHRTHPLTLPRLRRRCRHRDIGDGAYDDHLVEFGEDAARDGRRVTVRTLHEHNGEQKGSWPPWRVFTLVLCLWALLLNSLICAAL